MVSVVVLWVGSRGRPTRNVIDRSVEWSSNFSISTFPITIWSILFKELLTSLVVVGANNRNAMNYALLRSCCCLLFAFSMTMTTMANTMCGLKKRPFFSLYMITFTQWSRRAYSTPLRLKKNNNGLELVFDPFPAFFPFYSRYLQSQKLQCDIVSGNPSGQFVLLSIIGLTSRYSTTSVVDDVVLAHPK